MVNQLYALIVDKISFLVANFVFIKHRNTLRLTTPCLVFPKLGLGVVHEEYVRTIPSSGIHSITESSPI